MGFWRGAFRSGQTYDLGKLVDHRLLDPVVFDHPGTHIICDIDKTYLETDFESIARMAKIAFERADEKVTVAGAREVLLEARWGYDPDQGPSAPPKALHFVSSSPPQLRKVLEEKLMIDGLDWSSDTFKNQAYNIRMGRMDLLRQHVGYKSLAILNLVTKVPSGSTIYMIGDNAESDAYIYFGIKSLLDRSLSKEGYLQYLAAGGVEKSSLKEVDQIITQIPKAEVSEIFIRHVPGYDFIECSPMTDTMIRFENFYEVAMVLIATGVIPPGSMWKLSRSFHNRYELKIEEILGILLAYDHEKEKGADFSVELKSVIDRLVLVPNKGPYREYAIHRTSDSKLSEGDIVEKAQEWMEKILGSRAK